MPKQYIKNVMFLHIFENTQKISVLIKHGRRMSLLAQVEGALVVTIDRYSIAFHFSLQNFNYHTDFMQHMNTPSENIEKWMEKFSFSFKINAQEIIYIYISK